VASAGRAVLISGATGLIGSRLAAELSGDGVPVRVLTRDPRRASGALDPKFVLVRWDGTRVPGEAVTGSGAVVHLAGEPLFAGRLSGDRRRRVRESRLASTRAVVDAIGALPPDERPEALVCASAVGIYGDRGDEELDEDSPPGEGFLAELCRDWERAARQVESHGVRAVSLRFGVVLSSAGGALPAMARIFRLGLGGRLGSGRQWFPWVHLDDAVALLRACLDDPAWTGPVNAVSPRPVRNREFTRLLARALHRPAPFAVPAFVLRAALGELSVELLGSRRVAPGRARDRDFAFGYATLESALARELGSDQ
jgi:uncharacterized protein (TIGR01777 family)